VQPRLLCVAWALVLLGRLNAGHVRLVFRSLVADVLAVLGVGCPEGRFRSPGCGHGVAAGHGPVVMVGCVQVVRKSQTVQVAGADHLAPLIPRQVQRRHEKGHQNGDDSDDDEQLDQRECLAFHCWPFPNHRCSRPWKLRARGVRLSPRWRPWPPCRSYNTRILHVRSRAWASDHRK
jgi:hypothetical protein